MEPISAKVLLEGLCPGEDISVTGVVTDSRKVIPGCVFVCFPGARVDGHDFARECYDKGAAYIVANRILEGIPEDRQILVADSPLGPFVPHSDGWRTAESPCSKWEQTTGSVFLPPLSE